ncbi:MAG TPA: hypothetical protein VGM56_23470 [Byssovorax sp.]|jgi:hypothetical protein
MMGALVARAAFGLTLLAAASKRIPVLLYVPIERRWAMSAPSAGIAMAWFGAVLDALVVSAIAAAVALAVWRARQPSRSTVLAVARAGALVLAVDLAYFGWTMAHEDIQPPPDCAAPSQSLR